MTDLSYIDETRQMLKKLLPAESIMTINQDQIKDLVKKRDPKAHKGCFGHALLYAGSYGMAGAAVLSAKACMRSGVGLLTVCTPPANNDILQISVPEAMVVHTDDMYAESDFSRYSAIGAGPGLGKGDSQTALLDKILKSASCPTVLDADALNILSQNSYLQEYIPAGSVITPHPGELARLTGNTPDWTQMTGRAIEFARQSGITVVVKGAPTVTVTPQGTAYINTTGNAGMATGGSGDVLTGITLALLAQGYSALDSALTAVYIHGVAGDIAAAQLSQTAMTSADIISCLPQAWLKTEIL
ncbi:MAG: NAD(P)H-hydrate dehydratase [Bacteroidaceae bacterium]|nr:NAD(P)H-hydrate dehydratase [Bacteroidaceae bacterium]